MCGILGYIAYGDDRPSVTSFKKSLEECSTRGSDATGIFAPNVGIVKKDLDASEFIIKYDDQIKEAIKSNIILAHCRATTQGPETNNVNNHPHESENFILIHNGSIRKSEKIDGYKYLSDCDSEIILSYVEKHGVEGGLKEMISSDPMAIALFDKRNSEVYLFRNSNPIDLLISESEKIIYFASTNEILKPLYKRKDFLGFQILDSLTPFTTKSETLYKIHPTKGLIFHKEINQKTYVWKERNYNNNYFPAGRKYSNYQNEDLNILNKKWCHKCESLHKESDNCVVSSHKKSSSRHNLSREISYRGGFPHYVLFDTQEEYSN